MTDYDSFEDASSALQVEYKKLNQLFSDAISRLNSGKEQAKQQMGLLRNVEAEFSQENPVTIALLGGTGHGKSTLANAILDKKCYQHHSQKFVLLESLVFGLETSMDLARE